MGSDEALMAFEVANSSMICRPLALELPLDGSLLAALGGSSDGRAEGDAHTADGRDLDERAIRARTRSADSTGLLRMLYHALAMNGNFTLLDNFCAPSEASLTWPSSSGSCRSAMLQLAPNASLRALVAPLAGKRLQLLEIGSRNGDAFARIVACALEPHHPLRNGVSPSPTSSADSILHSSNFIGGGVQHVEDAFAADPARERIDRATGKPVHTPKMAVISHTVMSASEAVTRFRDTGILQHLCITRAGEVVQFVDLSRRAWHAGVAFWGPIGTWSPIGNLAASSQTNDVNSHSIGITLEGNGCEYEFTNEQYDTLRAVLAQLRSAYNIKGADILSFGEVAHPPGRHVAPGHLFDWSRIDAYDDAIITRAEVQRAMQAMEETPSAEQAAECLKESGYSIGDTPDLLQRRLETVALRFLGQTDASDDNLRRCACAVQLCRSRALLMSRL